MSINTFSPTVDIPNLSPTLEDALTELLEGELAEKFIRNYIFNINKQLYGSEESRVLPEGHVFVGGIPPMGTRVIQLVRGTFAETKRQMKETEPVTSHEEIDEIVDILIRNLRKILTRIASLVEDEDDWNDVYSIARAQNRAEYLMWEGIEA